ncbi:hypothetical protein N0V95_005933 [Ascochyta clinopodiicola]|nr:hypothetical protein N0V95_005933 [Ascochyta clinopodiicola]
MSCELSTSAAAFSTMLTAFIGSVINGLCSGALIAFITGWISWFAVVRILVAGLFELRIAIKAGTNFDAANHAQYQNIDMDVLDRSGDPPPGVGSGVQSTGTEDMEALIERQNPDQDHSTGTHLDDPPIRTDEPVHTGKRPKVPQLARLERTVTALGWVGWVWSAVYTPVSQTIWLSVHIASSDGIHQFVRALAISVSALGLTFDYKQRYAAVLGRRYGAWAFVVFNAWNTAACLLLGTEALVLLIHGAKNISNVPIPLVVAYPIFSIVWAAGSWAFLPPIDGARPGNIFAGVLMGAFAGLFVAAPAFSIWQNAQFAEKVADMMGESAPEGLDLGDFLACESASAWAKFAAVMP